MVTEKGGEFRGKTVDAAISNGLAALGVSRDQVEVEIVRPGSRGLLGIGAEDAVVHLTVASIGQTQAPARPASRPEQAPGAVADTAPRSDAPRQAQRQDRPARSERQERAPRPESRGQSRPPRVRTEDSAAWAAGAVEDGDAAERGRIMLTGLLERMDIRAQVEIVPQSPAETDEDEDVMVLNIVGDDLGLLIGRQSEVLTSLQFITRLMINQQTHSRTDVVVDVNGYKAKRAESLQKLALRTAEQVMQTGRTMSLEPMPASERRVIHLALRNHPGVMTESVGEGTRRKVTVVLKK